MLKSVHFEGIKSLLNVSIDLERFTVLVGPNGCGKSTVLDQIHLLGEVVRPESTNSNNFGAAGVYLSEHDPDTVRTLNRAAPMTWGGKDEFSSYRLVIGPIEPGVHWGGRLSITARSSRIEKSVAFAGAPSQSRKELEAALAAISSWRTQRLALVPAMIAAPSGVSLTRLESDGFGTPTVLKDLASDHHQAFVDIQTDLQKVVPHFRELRIPKIAGGDPKNGLDLVMVQGRVPSSKVSDGTLLALALLTVVHHPDMAKVILIDDIDHGLHLGAQLEMLKAVRAVMAVRPELQVICTTHSPYFLHAVEVEEVRVMALDADGHTVVKPLAAHPDITKWRAAMTAGELWANLGEDWLLAR